MCPRRPQHDERCVCPTDTGFPIEIMIAALIAVVRFGGRRL